MTFITRSKRRMLGNKEKDPSTESFDKGDLFSNIKGLLMVGRLIFLLPCQGLIWKSHHHYVFRRNSFPTAICLLIITWCIVKAIVGLKFLLQISHGGVVGRAHPAHYFVVSSILTFIYIYYFVKSDQLKELFSKWNNLATSGNFELNVFALRRVTACALLSMIFPFMINFLFTIDGVYRLDGQELKIPGNITALECVYERLLQQWNSILPYSKYFTLFCLADFVFGSLPRSFVIATVIVFSYALSKQFKDLVERGNNKINTNDRDTSNNGAFWMNLVKKHDALTDLVSDFDEVLSPLIFITYVTSVYLICIQLLRALSSSTGHKGAELTVGLSPFIYNLSFCVEVFLLYFMSIFAAQLNHWAHQIGTVLKKCPAEYQSFEVTRLENRVNFGPRIGFTGLNCFVITKPFLLTIANAIITLEIVLLQAQVTQPVLGTN